MTNRFTRGFFKAVAFSLMPLSAVALAETAIAQLITQSPPAGFQTICRYNPESGFPNALGMRTYITVTESAGDTTFTLDRFPAFVTNPADIDRRADVSEMRSLTLYDTPIAEARQLMIDQPFYYANLLEAEAAELVQGFEAVDQTLGCGQVAIEPETEPETEPEAPEPETPTAETPPEAAPEEPTEPTTEKRPPLSALPNGNYRYVSAQFDQAFDQAVVSDEELTEAGGAIFLFRKFGDTITGEMSFVDAEVSRNFCIAGEADGEVLVGSFVSGGDRTLANNVVTTTEQEDGTFVATLNISEFSRINAGTRLPIETCSSDLY